MKGSDYLVREAQCDTSGGVRRSLEQYAYMQEYDGSPQQIACAVANFEAMLRPWMSPRGETGERLYSRVSMTIAGRRFRAERLAKRLGESR